MVSKVVFFGHDMGTTGTLAVTGVGFQPTALIVVAASNSDGMASWAYVDDNGLDKSIYRLDSASVACFRFTWGEADWIRVAPHELFRFAKRCSHRIAGPRTHNGTCESKISTC